MPRKKGKAKVERATHAALERALREERLAIAAIVKVMLLEVPEPARVLARLETMTRAAEQNPRTSAMIRRQLLDATRFVRGAIERELRKPQSLLEPHVGHIPPAEVDKLVKPTEGPQQLGFAGQQSMLNDVEVAHDERVGVITSVQAAIIQILKAHGAATDRQIYARYAQLRAGASSLLPWQSAGGISDRRKELAVAGRVVSAKKKVDNETTWDLVERELTA